MTSKNLQMRGRRGISARGARRAENPGALTPTRNGASSAETVTLTVPPPSTSSIEYHLAHAARCVAIVERLGGLERAQRIAEALA